MNDHGGQGRTRYLYACIMHSLSSFHVHLWCTQCKIPDLLVIYKSDINAVFKSTWLSTIHIFNFRNIYTWLSIKSWLSYTVVYDKKYSRQLYANYIEGKYQKNSHLFCFSNFIFLMIIFGFVLRRTIIPTKSYATYTAQITTHCIVVRAKCTCGKCNDVKVNFVS